MTSETPTSTTPQHSPILEDAWARYGKYDKNATIAQKRFVKERKLILILGVAGTALAVLYTVLKGQNLPSLNWLPVPDNVSASVLPYFLEGVRFLVVSIPIIAGALATFTNKFNQGANWIVLRSSAEALKKEIYRYRMQVEEYSPANTEIESRDMQMARKLKLISRRMMETQVSQSGLEPYRDQLPPKYGTADGDDGFTDMTADQYMAARVDDQFNYYQKKSVKFGKEAQRFEILILVMGITGALLAAFQLEIWVAVSGSLVTAFTSYLEFRRVESTIISCNRAAADLYDIRTWWRALPESARQEQTNIESLVSSTEAVIQTENAGWVQEMRDALTEIIEGKKAEADAKAAGQEGEKTIAADGTLVFTPIPSSLLNATATTNGDGSSSGSSVDQSPGMATSESFQSETDVADPSVESSLDASGMEPPVDDPVDESLQPLSADPSINPPVDESMQPSIASEPVFDPPLAEPPVDGITIDGSIIPESAMTPDSPDADGAVIPESAMTPDSPDAFIEAPLTDSWTDSSQSADASPVDPSAPPADDTPSTEPPSEPQESEPSIQVQAF